MTEAASPSPPLSIIDGFIDMPDDPPLTSVSASVPVNTTRPTAVHAIVTGDSGASGGSTRECQKLCVRGGLFTLSLLIVSWSSTGERNAAGEEDRELV
jgi:hypothetical protein